MSVIISVSRLAYLPGSYRNRSLSYLIIIIICCVYRTYEHLPLYLHYFNPAPRVVWPLRNVSTQISLRIPRRLIRADTFRIRGIEV